MTAGLIGIGIVYAALVLGAQILRHGEIEAWPDRPAWAARRRHPALLYHLDNLLGHISLGSLAVALIRNAATGKSRRAHGSAWRWTRIVMWRPGPMGYKDLARRLQDHGVLVLWWGLDGDRFYFHVRETQTAWALDILRNGPKARTWASRRPSSGVGRRPVL